MTTTENFLRIASNFFGLACFIVEKQKLKISNKIALKNYFLALSIVTFKILLMNLADLTVFLPDGVQLEVFTSFSIVIYTTLIVIPFLTSCYFIFIHQVKRFEILKFLISMKIFNDQFIVFAKSKTFLQTRSKYFYLVFVYLTICRVVENALLMKFNVWVISSYLLKALSELILMMFVFLFSNMIEYSIYLLKNFNQRLEYVMEFGNVRELEICGQFYENTFNLISRFYEIFGQEISIFTAYIVSRLVLLVRISLHIMKIVYFNFLSQGFRNYFNVNYFNQQ